MRRTSRLGFRRAEGSRRPRALPPALTLVGWVALVPLGLLALGVWQAGRAAEDVATAAQARAELPETLARLRRLAAERPNAVVRDGGGRPFAAALAITRVEASLARAETDGLVSRVRAALAWGTAGGGALALLAGLVGVGTASLAGAAARVSRERLVSGFSFVRRALPFLLGAQVAGLAVAAVAAILFEAGGLWFAERVSGGVVKLAFLGLLMAGLAFYGAFVAVRGLRQVFALAEPEPLDVGGREVGEAEAPGLWRFVRELARRQDALEPDAVVVGLTEGFFVVEGPVRLHPENRLVHGRVLHLPAPYLGLLGGREVAAIVGHELAHFSGEDTRYSRRFAPLYAGFGRALDALRAGQGASPVLLPAVRLGFHALHVFDAAVARWSQARELEADRGGAVVSGPEAAASALLRTSALAPLVAETLREAFEDEPDAPDAPGPDLVERVAAAVAASGVPAVEPEDRQPHPTDSHPPDRRRIAALGVALDERLLALARRPPGEDERALPFALFADWPGLRRALSDDFLAHAGRRRAERRAWLEEVAAAAPADETVLSENARPLAWTLAVLAGLMVAAGAAILLFAQPLGLAHDPGARTLVLGVAAAIAVAAGLCAAFALRRAATPVLVLTPDALHSPRLREAIPWDDVADVQVTAGYGLEIVLALDEGRPPPVLAGFSLRTRWSRRKGLLTLRCLGIRGLKPDGVADLLGRYLAAARARRALAPRTRPPA